MTNDKKSINEGYIPKINERGYQPTKPAPQPSGEPKPQSGYVPTTSGGDNPTNNPTPPGEE
ncbi:MAG: hypothetical protein ACW7DQ_13590 [Paraglaciecola chathamensis]